MAELSIHKTHHPVQLWLPSLLLTALIAAAASWLAGQPAIASWGLGSLTLAIVLGIIMGNSVYSPLALHCDAGVVLAKQKLLRCWRPNRWSKRQR